VAVVTNLQPNHLDRHGTLDHYAAAKKNIFRRQGPDDVLVINAAPAAGVAGWAAEAPGRVEWFSADAAEPFDLAVPGRHNQANAQAAWAAARQFGVTREAAAEALAGFRGLPHRLELIAERGGVRFFNDSKCTTPEGAMVALAAFAPRRAVVIVGGSDKGSDFAPLGRALAERAKAVVATGVTGQRILAAVEAARPAGAAAPAISYHAEFAAAVRAALALAASGDAALLSPACASYDQFANYEHRGRRFCELIMECGGSDAALGQSRPPRQ
jgi:UDP-N-acetylmuramoylalanine--D-glutamate ligase